MALDRFKLGLLFTGVTILLATAATADLPKVSAEELAAQIQAKKSGALVIQVGPNMLFRSKHIPGAVFAGPGNRPEGLELLKTAVKDVPRDREIVLYCGCCPWDHCPNLNPAIAVLRDLGYKKVKTLYIANNFKADWTDRGYPVE